MNLTRRLFLTLLTVLATAPAGLAQETSTSTATLRIYVTRHGESESNVAGVTTGWTDSALTARGRRQARELAGILNGIALDAVYSSTLARSLDTAKVAGRGRPVQALDGLKERNWGRFTGTPTNDPEFARRRVLDDDALDGGETRETFYQRVRDAVADIRRQHPAGEVLIVGHGATNAQVLRALLNLSPAETDRIVQDNEEVYAIDLFDNRPPLLWKLIRSSNLGEL